MIRNIVGEIDEPRSQASAAYQFVRRDIIAGRFPPMAKLKIHDLARELTVSPGAVREALSRLVAENLVTSRDQRGFAVAELSIADLQDLTELRCEVEAIALNRSLDRGDIEWESRLLAAAHRLRATPQRLASDGVTQNPEWRQEHAAFHHALVSGCQSRRLLSLHAQLYEQSERYRVLSASYNTARDLYHEHDIILKLALARKRHELIEAMQAHIRRPSDNIVSASRKQGAGSA